MKVCLLFVLIGFVLGGCTALQSNHQKIGNLTERIITPIQANTYSTFETKRGKYGIADYKLPKVIRPLPIEIYTWYPIGTTLFLPIENMSIKGRFVWHDECLLLENQENNELVTPIFWVNSLKEYQANSMIISHTNRIIPLNQWHYIDTTPQSIQSEHSGWLVSRGQEKCLKDKIIFLPMQITERG